MALIFSQKPSEKNNVQANLSCIAHDLRKGITNMILKRITVPRFKGAKFNKWGLLCITIFSLMACSGTPSSLTYYLLHSPSSGAMSETYPTTAKLVIIDRITLPEYLKHRGLVYQTSDTNCIFRPNIYGQSPLKKV